MVCPELHFNLSKQMHNHKCYMLHLCFSSSNSLQIGHYHFTEPSQDASLADGSDCLLSAPGWAVPSAQADQTTAVVLVVPSQSASSPINLMS